MRSFPEASRSRAAAGPQVGVQRGFQAGDRQQVGPGGTGQDVGDPRADGAADPRVPPAVVTGFTLDKPRHAPGPKAIRVLADVRRRDHPAGFLAGDRAYNNTAPDDFQLPARALGYRLIFDYRQDQLGIQAGTAGAQLIEGTWYCPALPHPLVTATSDLHDEAIDQETWTRRIAARIPFQLVPKQHPDHEGHQRMSCPAASDASSARSKPPASAATPACPWPAPSRLPPDRPRSAPSSRSPSHRRPEPSTTRSFPMAARTGNASTSVRNSVEGFNGFAKDPLHEAIEQPGTRRIRGTAAHDPAGLPTRPRQPPQDRPLAVHHPARRAPTPPTPHPLPTDQTDRQLEPHRPPHLSVRETSHRQESHTADSPSAPTAPGQPNARPHRRITSQPRQHTNTVLDRDHDQDPFRHCSAAPNVGAPLCARGDLNPHALKDTGT